MNTITSFTKLKDLKNTIKNKFIIYEKLIYIIGIIIAVLITIASIIYRHINTSNLNRKSGNLYDTSSHNLTRLQNEDTLKDISPLRRTIGDMISFQENTLEKLRKNNEQRVRLSVPFENFLHMFYLPSLNIWKDPFSGEIDTSLIGKKYIDNNPYDDIALINSWTNFFKDVGVVDSYNTVTDIKIGELTNTINGEHFHIPITVDFETPDKRSFLLLVNKISLTAYLQNISLINEFMFYLWESIKENQTDLINQYRNNNSIIVDNQATHDDKIIGYLLYDWIINDTENNIVTQNIILNAISKATSCSTEDIEECLYKFRDKMRAIPYLAYGVARSNIDMVNGLKFFFKTMPPLISIESFTFEDNISKVTRTREGGYKGSISLKVYGKDITNAEKDSISQKLGQMCFTTRQPLSIEIGLLKAEKALNDLGQQTLNTQRSLSLNQIISFFSDVQTTYENLPNHRKVIRLFEIYRTLQENNLCDIVDNESILEENIGFAGSISVDTGELEVTQDQITDLDSPSTQRTINDGKGKRDREFDTLLDELENESPRNTESDITPTPNNTTEEQQLVNELNE